MISLGVLVLILVQCHGFKNVPRRFWTRDEGETRAEEEREEGLREVGLRTDKELTQTVRDRNVRNVVTNKRYGPHRKPIDIRLKGVVKV